MCISRTTWKMKCCLLFLFYSVVWGFFCYFPPFFPRPSVPPLPPAPFFIIFFFIFYPMADTCKWSLVKTVSTSIHFLLVSFESHRRGKGNQFFSASKSPGKSSRPHCHPLFPCSNGTAKPSPCRCCREGKTCRVDLEITPGGSNSMLNNMRSVFYCNFVIGDRTEIQSIYILHQALIILHFLTVTYTFPSSCHNFESTETEDYLFCPVG